MEISYKVEAKSNYKHGIDVTFKGLSIDTAMECALTLILAFPQVDVICEQTGEVMYSQYHSLDIFRPSVEQGKAIFHAECDCCF